MKTITRIALIYALCVSKLIQAQHDTNTGFDFIVAQDGVWTWYNDERAAFKNDRLYTSYVKKDGKVALSVNNIKTGANLGTETVLSTWIQKDDHNNAAILLRQDGKLMAFYSPHIREKENYFRASNINEPLQQSDWSNQTTQITTNDSDNKGATYNNAFQLSAEGGRIYNFMRTNNFNPNWKEYSADGTPLRSGQDIILFKNGNGDVRPYVKYTSNNTDRIDFFFTDGHPRNADNNLYHCYYKTNANGTQGNIYQTDGTLIVSLQSVINGTPIDVSQVSKLYVFGSDGTNARAWTHNINYDSDNNPVVTYSKQINISNITYHYARWTGTQWVNNLVTDAGNGLYNGEDDYTGIITTNPYNTNEIFMSSNRNPITGIEDNRYEIYSAITSDGGTTWNWTEVTKDSDKDNLRPFVPKGIANADDRVVLWFHGDYITYQNYNTRIVGEYINKVYDGPAPDLGEPIPPINTNITYGVDINTSTSSTLSPFKSMVGASNASTTDNGVTFTLFGSNIDTRDRGTETPNDVVRDFAFNNPEVSNGSIGIRIENLPDGDYTFNSFHYDNNFPTNVTVTLQEQGGVVLQTKEVNNSEAPASFQVIAEAGKVYEVIATENNTDNNRVRFNGLSIIEAGTASNTVVKIDIDTQTNNTKTGYTGMLGTENTTVSTDNGDYLLFGFTKQPATNSDADALISDFAVNSDTNPAGTPAIGLRMTNLTPGTYAIKSWHYDPTVTSSTIKIQMREAGFGNPQTDLLTGVSLGNTDASTYEITVESGKNYDLIFRADNDGLESRFNGIEISPTNSLTISTPEEIPVTIAVYPNPFKDTFNMLLKDQTAFTHMVLYDLAGKKVFEQKNNQNDDVIQLNPSVGNGIYILTIYDNNKIVSKKKLIKK